VEGSENIVVLAVFHNEQMQAAEFRHEMGSRAAVQRVYSDFYFSCKLNTFGRSSMREYRHH